MNHDFSLCQEFSYYVNGAIKTIPKGFTTDLASIPSMLWSIYAPQTAQTIPAAIIHDYLYFCPGKMTRAEADCVFYDALILQGFPKLSAWKYWAAVRLFGSSHFNEGAICPNAYPRTENAVSYLRVAFPPISLSG